MVLNIVIILINVAFLTLLERKVLSYIQLRKGPNKVSIIGLLQPIVDAIKLFNKETLVILKSNYVIFLFRPIFRIILILGLWIILPIFSNLYSFNLVFIYILCVLRIRVYGLIIAGWSSNSMYSLIGSLRSIAQTISYEVSLILMIIIILILVESFILIDFYNYQKNLIIIVFLLPISFIILVSILAELNRTPFDFAEGESELVSGFNVEYISGVFALIFISEYGNILFIRFLFLVLVVKCNFMDLIFYVNFIVVVIFIIWRRASFPRFRYDNLIYLTWKVFLFLVLYYLFIILLFKINI